MLLESIRAAAHPDGNRIDVDWILPAGASVDGVRVVRRAGTFPEHPDDGVTVAASAEPGHAVDVGMQAERMYYYALFPWTGDPPVFDVDPRNRTAALATAPHATGDFMMSLLPAIYHRYDLAQGTLRRFLSVTGGQLDQLQSFARFTRQLQNVDEAPGELLPVLGEWIGWQTDFKRSLEAQRDEIRNAPAVFQRVGLVPTVEATIKRISGWETRSKEYVHNVFASNRPERLNLWAQERDAAGDWSATESLLSLDFVYDGRPASVRDDHDVHWIFYHTARKQRWEIWAKSTASVTLPLSLAPQFAAGVIAPALWAALTDNGVTIAQDATVSNLDTNAWEIVDGPERWVAEVGLGAVVVYHTSGPATALAASEPVVVDAHLDRYPTASLQDDTLWLFWSAYDTQSARWRIRYKRRSNARWTQTAPAIPDGPADLVDNPFVEGGVFNSTRQRRQPSAVADDTGRLWLFWFELLGGRWQVRYNRRDAGAWGEPVTMPDDGGAPPRADADLMVMATSDPAPRLWVFWSRYAPIASGESRHEIAVRMKADQAHDANNWSAVHRLPKGAVDDHHDREPFAILDGADLRLFWSSNRDAGGWSIWQSTLEDLDTDDWSAPDRITEPVYSQRAPLPVLLADDRLWLLFRGNRNVPYLSTVYRATDTFDERYAGSRCTDVRHQEQIVLRGRFTDPQRYTCDTGANGVRTDDDRIGRDTLGAFVAVDTLGADEIAQGIARLRPVVREFIPLTDRVVFVSEPQLHTEYVYSYDLPPATDARYLVSSYSDEWVSVAEDDALDAEEDFSAILDE